MPLTRHVMHVAGEDIHVAQWPMVKEMNLVASRHYAFEGRCFVVATGALLRASQLPESLPASPEVDPEALILRGGSAVIAPDGRYLAGPVYDEPALVTADLDLAEIAKESMALDVTGHYHRPDLFKLELLRS